VAFVIATFGSTDASGLDDVAGIRAVIEEVTKKFGVTPPQLHVDAAAGWPLCFLNEYDVNANPFELHPEVLDMIRKIKVKALGIQQADSVTIDFHKMGWGHYPSSAFIVRRRDDLALLLRRKEQVPYFSEADYRHDPALFTLECSRPALGPYAVMASLDGIGLTGYQILVAHALDLAAELKRRIGQLKYCQVLNRNCLGPHVLFWVLPKGRNAGKIYADLVKGVLKEKEYGLYFRETARLFEKRKAAMDPAVDARLSFTTAMGFYPHDISLPAWKAVFFNPRTDRAVIDNLIASLEEL
jgi:glutamate/tyrosine decarboxylase-like PLP-dependent enzyme